MDLVYEVATRCHNLTKLNISGVPDFDTKPNQLLFDLLSDAGIMNITYSQDQLESLELRKLNKLTSEGLEHVCSNKLTKVDLRGCISIESKGWSLYYVEHVLYNTTQDSLLGLFHFKMYMVGRGGVRT